MEEGALAERNFQANLQPQPETKPNLGRKATRRRNQHKPKMKVSDKH